MSRRRWLKNKQANKLISKEDIRSGRSDYFQHDRDNAVLRLDDEARMEIQSIMDERYMSAKDTTLDIREKMDKWDKIYNAEWQDGGDTEDRIYLPKTREELLVIYSFFITIITQISPLVEMEPLGTQTIWGIEDDYKRAKLAEAFVEYYMEEQWRFKDIALPLFLKHFLKYTMGVFKLTYLERDWKPDLYIDVVDRAFLFLDPKARRFEKQGWIFEEFYLSRAEIYDRIDNEDWLVREEDMDYIDSYQTEVPDTLLTRIFGDQAESYTSSVPVDDCIRCHEYWQFAESGLPSLYCVIIGDVTDGLLVRYGDNPYPYKGNPYVAASYDDSERPDGTGFIQQQEQLQKVMNTFLNLRLTDVRKNINQSSIVAGMLVDQQTQDDIKAGNRIVRAAPEAERWLQANNRRMQDLMAELPSGTSTKELLSMDLPYIQQQFQDSSNVRDVFKGVTPPAGTPLGTFQELLARSQGVFRPAVRSLMLCFEDIARMMMSYARDPEFYDDERLIRIVGKNKYQDIIQGWTQVGNASFKSISPDDVDVDTTFNAVNGADSAIARTMLVNTLSETIQSIGQIPQLFDVLSKEFDFNAIFSHMINISNADIEGLKLTQEQKQKRDQEIQQQQQQAEQQRRQQIQEQMQLQLMIEKNKKMIEVQGDIAFEQAKAKNQIQAEWNKITAKFTGEEQMADVETANKIRQDAAKIEAQTDSDMAIMQLQLELDKLKMRLEAELEAKQGVSSVGHDFNVSSENQAQ